MDNIINAQRDTKTYFRVIVSAIALVLSITLSNVYAVPPERIESCERSGNTEFYDCCWTEIEEGDPEKIEIYLCQFCEIVNNEVECTPPYPDPRTPPTTEEDISPGDTGVLEQPPQTNDPPIKSGDSVFPNNDGVAEDQQSEEPSIKSNQGIILEERTIETDSQQNPLFEGKEETSLESTESENPSSETSNLEQTTNFAKKGNDQNSPVPPECPKQGPIPPDCTMKPKF